MKLYDGPAPNPRRVRIFLREKGRELPTVKVDLRAGEQLQEPFRAINQDCTVPVLELDDGTRLTEVFAICQYLEHAWPEPPLMGAAGRERSIVTMWNARIEQQGVAAVAEVFRNKTPGLENRGLPGPVNYAQIPALVKRGRKRTNAFLDRMEGHFADSRYVVGESFTIADITALVTVEFARYLKFDVGDEVRPNLARWFGEVGSRPSVPD